MRKKEYFRPLKITGKKLKIGFDTNVMVFIITEPQCKFYFDSKIHNFNKGAYFFIYELCYNEIINTLVDKYDYNKEEAVKECNKVLKDYKINKIRYKKEHFKKGEYILGLCKECGLHKPDNVIIAGYKSINVDIIYSNDNHFLDSCNNIGITGRKFPSLEKIIAKKLKKLFK